MDKNKTILIYNDSSSFGGHEVMTLHLANTLVEKYNVVCMFNNVDFINKLDNRINKVKISNNILGRFPLISIFNIFNLFYLKSRIKKLNIDITIICQGVIELGVLGAVASLILNIKTYSYIPQCSKYVDMDAKVGHIRDFIHKLLIYPIFNGFITVSNYEREKLNSYINHKKVDVLENFIEEKLTDTVDISFSDKIKIGVVGRITKLKGQYKTIDIAKLLIKEDINFKFVLIGDGPDRRRTELLIKRSNLEDYFEFKGWINDKKEIYDNIDILLNTSKVEAVPLVMLEALMRNKVFIAPNEGAFKEYLSDDFLYSDINDLVLKIKQIIEDQENVNKKLNILREKIIERNNKEKFKSCLFKIVEEL